MKIDRINNEKIKTGLRLSDKITALSGVGDKRAILYNNLGVDNIYSLLQFYPRDYLDLTAPVAISEAILDQTNVIKATVYKRVGEQFIRRGLTLFKVYVTDGDSNLTITIFNSRYQFDELSEGEEYYFHGKVTGTLLKREMTSPTFIKAEGTTKLRPIYNLTAGLSNKMVQTQVSYALKLIGERLFDFLPTTVTEKYNLCHLRYALQNIHEPTDKEALEIARKRLIFEELLILQIGLIMLRRKNRAVTGISLENSDISEFYSALPFTLTDGQQQAISDGLNDMNPRVNSVESPASDVFYPMNRLCQGDVGSGKTMVAAALCYACHKNSLQSAIMAPTQILADQHYNTFKGLFTPLGVKVCLLTGSQKTAERKIILDSIISGECSIVIGTHTLVQDSVKFHKLGLVVTDEQHRFGVSQRARLSNKGDNPHLLVMSATPIPRTLALIIYGDLDISVIRELPKGRQPIDTHYIHSGIRARSLGFVQKQLDAGRQAYIVCPLIEENDSDLISITQYIKALQATPLSKYRVESLNGKLKSAEKDSIMARFKVGQIDILVSTTVVEVGVDVPNATIMLVENAERFGLSQLHQLRGRVGRGEHKSYCILISDNQGEDNKTRLKTMVNTSDGFLIAEEDLKLRGPGDFFGLKQHGLPSLKIANLVNDMEILQETQSVAKDILTEDENLKLPQNKGLRFCVSQLFNKNEQLILN